MFKITYNAKVVGKGVDSVIGNVYDFSTRSGVGTGIITLNYVIKPDSTVDITVNVSDKVVTDVFRGTELDFDTLKDWLEEYGKETCTDMFNMNTLLDVSLVDVELLDIEVID